MKSILYVFSVLWHFFTPIFLIFCLFIYLLLLFFFLNEVECVCLQNHMFSEISPPSLRKSYSYSPRIPQNSISTSVSIHSMKQLIIYVLVPWIKLLTSHGWRVVTYFTWAEFGTQWTYSGYCYRLTEWLNE